MSTAQKFSPCLIEERLRALRISDEDIKKIKSSFSDTAINSCINLLRNHMDSNKAKLLFEMLYGSDKRSGSSLELEKKYPEFFRGVEEADDYFLRTPKQERDNFMLELQALPHEKIARLTYLITNNLHDLRIFPLPEGMKYKIMQDIKNGEFKKSHRIALSIRMLLKATRKSLSDNF